jgi:hypothetical protein
MNASPEEPRSVRPMIEQTGELSAAVLHSVTEDELAAWRRHQGYCVSAHRGRFWMRMPPGFLQPLHWMARFSTEEASPPATLCWGFRTVLSEEEAQAANGALPVHVLTDVGGYTMESLSSNRRNHLRRCYKRAALVEITGPAPMRQQGYEVCRSALKRTGYGRVQLKKTYLSWVETWFGGIYRVGAAPIRRCVVLGAFIDNRLSGYLKGFAVAGTAYIEQVHLATEALPHDIGIGLVFEFVQVCRRSKGIREIIYGQHSREDEALCSFKEKSGFPVQRFPTRFKILPIVARLLRLRYPHKYYRLTGT